MLNFLNYLVFFAVDVALLLGAGFVYTKSMPSNELTLIAYPGRNGNTAAAIALGGAMLGFAIVLYVATQRADILSTIMWSVIALLTQIGAFWALRALVHDDWDRKMKDGDLAHGVMLGAFSLTIGIINAGCIT